MINSGIKRGLATIAVSALAVSGLGAFGGAAHAVSIDDQQGPTADVNFYTQINDGASIANDGVNTTVSLVAGASADVKQVKFTYQVGSAAEQTIATVDRVNGAFSAQWTPPANVLGGSVTLKAVGLDAAGAPITAAEDVNTGVAVAGATKAVAIGNAAGSSVGAYTTPGGTTKAIVSGTTDATAVTGLDDVVVGTPNAAGIRNFSGVQELTGYTWSTATPKVDEAVLYAATADSDDAVPVKLYKQTISAAGVTATPATAQVSGAATTNVTVKVVDQNGKPVAGAIVADSAAPAATKQTDAKGEAVFSGYGAGTPKFHVDMTAVAGFDNGVDIQKTVTISSYTAALTTLTTTATKAVLDHDEIGASTFKVAAKDQNGVAVDTLPASLRGTWTFAPTTGTAPAPVPANINLATGEIDFPTAFAALAGVATLNVRNETDGNPEPSAGDIQAPALEVKVGEAAVNWDAANDSVQVEAGTDVTVKGKLALADGTVLAGRTVDLNIASGTPAGNAAFAPTADQPTGTTVAAGVATVTTAADGSFSVKVRDPKVPATVPPAPPAVQPTELNATITVAASGLGLASTPLDIDFQKLAVDSIGLAAVNLFDGKATPGRPVKYTGTVEGADGPLNNVSVELSLDKGFFVETDAAGDVVPEEAEAQGALWGDWKSAGTTASVTTNASGQFTVVVGIEGDDDFNDDFEADVTLTAVAGGKTQADKTMFSSRDALNVADVELAHAADQGAYGSTVLPKASTDRNVYVDIKATDQFGNRTDAEVDLVEAGVTGTVSETANSEDDNHAFVATSAEAGIQSFTATVTEDANTWNDTANNPPVTPAVAPVWDRATAADATPEKSNALKTEWYVVDLEAGSYTLSHSGDEWNAVGSIVTAFFEAKDQEGAPIRNLDVGFFRAGPGAVLIPWLGGVASDITDNDGQASVFFQGEQEGTAVISTVVIDDRGGPTDGDRVLAGTQSIDIKFGEEPVVEPPVVEPPVEDEPIDLNVKLKGKNNGKKKDKVKVIIKPVGEAAGAKVVLQRKNANGKWKKVAVKKANDSKKVVFKVKDRNGKKKTAYRAKIRKTATTNAATTNQKRIR